jgi:hypothetical protein
MSRNEQRNIIADFEKIMFKGATKSELKKTRENAVSPIDWASAVAPGNTTSRNTASNLGKLKKNAAYEDVGSELRSHLWANTKETGRDILDFFFEQLPGAGRNVLDKTIDPLYDRIPSYIKPFNGLGDLDRSDQPIQNPFSAFGEGFMNPESVKSGRQIMNEARFMGLSPKVFTENDKPWVGNPFDPSTRRSATDHISNLLGLTSATGGFATDVFSDPSSYLLAPVQFGSAGLKKAMMEANKIIKSKGLTGDAAEQVIKEYTAKANKQLIGVDVPFGKEFTLVNKPKFMTKKSFNIGKTAAEDLHKKLSAAGIVDNGGTHKQLASTLFNRDIKSFTDLNTQEYGFLMKQIDQGLGKVDLPDPFIKTGGKKVKNRKTMADQATNALDEIMTEGMNVKAPLRNKKQMISYLAKIGGISAKNLKDLPIDELKDMFANTYRISQLRPIAQAKGINFDELLGSKNPFTKQLIDQRKNIKTGLAAGVHKIGSKVEPKPKIDVDAEQIKQFAQASSKYKYIEGLDGTSALGKAVKGSKAFETLGKLLGSRRFVKLSSMMKEHRTQDGIDTVLDSRNEGFAMAKQKINELVKMVNKDDNIKALSKEELEMIPHVVEGKFPKNMPKDSIPSDRFDIMEKAAEKFKGFMDEITEIEKQAGIWDGKSQRDSYFPHIMNIMRDDESFNTLLAALRRHGKEGLANKLQHSPGGYLKERTGFQTMADLKDFLDDASKTDPEIKKLYENAAFNPVEAYGKRAISGIRDVTKANMMKTLGDSGLARPTTVMKLKRNKKTGEEKMVEKEVKNGPEGWTEIDVLGKKHFVPEDIAGEINKLDHLLNSTKELKKVLDQADAMYNIWRRNVTVTRVGFHVRQILGNIMQNTFAGVTPDAYAKAFKVLQNTDDPMYKEALENGVIHTGSASMDLATTIGKEFSHMNSKRTVWNNEINPLAEKFYLGKVGRKAGEYEDNAARMAHYIHMRESGMSMKQAKMSVRKYLYNYSEINDAGKVLRGFIPFYQWMRNNIPFQIVNAVKNPGKYALISHYLSDLQQEPDIEQTLTDMGIKNPKDREMLKEMIEEKGGLLPEYVKEKYINVGGNNYFNIGLPSTDINALSNDPAGFLFESLNPAIKAPVELMRNMNTLHGGKIDKYSDYGDPVFSTGAGLEHLARQVGGGPIDSILGILKGDPGQTARGVGVKPITVDPVKQLDIMMRKEANNRVNNRKRAEAKAQ